MIIHMYACHVVIYLHRCYWLLTIDHCRHIGVNIYIEYMYIVWLYLCMLFMRLNFYTSRGCFTWHFVVMCEYPLSVCIYDWSHAEVDMGFLVMDLYLLNVMHMCAGLVPGYLCIVIHWHLAVAHHTFYILMLVIV